jgi:hypothetical protein
MLARSSRVFPPYLDSARMWQPIELDDLLETIRDSQVAMEPATRHLWDLIRIDPVKWQQHPWGDEGGGFWVVALFGRRVLWYNDIEHGFNISKYTSPGVIAEYCCNQDDLGDALWALQTELEAGRGAGRFGAPKPLPRDGTQNT